MADTGGRRTELQIQTLFRSRARIQCPGVTIVAIPNGAKRGQRAMNQALREGMSPGFPDVMCFWPGKGIAGIEFKDEKGRLSLQQVEWLARLNNLGIPSICSRDPDHALAFLRRCGAPFLVSERRAA